MPVLEQDGSRFSDAETGCFHYFYSGLRVITPTPFNLSPPAPGAEQAWSRYLDQAGGSPCSAVPSCGPQPSLERGTSSPLSVLTAGCLGLDQAGSTQVLGPVYLFLPSVSCSSLSTPGQKVGGSPGRIVPLCFFPFFLAPN